MRFDCVLIFIGFAAAISAGLCVRFVGLQAQSAMDQSTSGTRVVLLRGVQGDLFLREALLERMLSVYSNSEKPPGTTHGLR
jgi:hypothetical protein